MAESDAATPKLIWRLLSDDGYLWISIDDDEHAYLKVLV